MKKITLKNRVLYVNQNENGSLTLYNEDGHIENNAGAIIGSFGGIEKFLERCEDINLSLEEFLNEKEKQQLLLREAEKFGEKTFLGSITLLKYKDLFYKKNKYVWKSTNEEEYIYLIERHEARLNEEVLKESRIIEEFNSLPHPIEANEDTLRIVLKYLNTKNWGCWNLPKLSIGYQAVQYDCDGKIATTITLDFPILCSDGEFHNKFTNAPRGYLEKYFKIR